MPDVERAQLDDRGAAVGRAVLLVESDEPDRSVRLVVESAGFRVVSASGAAAMDRFETAGPQAVVIDIGPNAFLAIDLCRDIRARSDVPILVLGSSSDETEVVLSFEVGADDFVARPYRERELIARLRTMVRRHDRLARSGVESGSEPVRVGDLLIDRGRHEAYLGDALVPLAPKEFEVLALLVERAGQVVTRDELLLRAWGEYVGDTKTLDTHIKRLRAKLEPEPLRPTRIITVRGVGFRYERTEAALVAVGG